MMYNQFQAMKAKFKGEPLDYKTDMCVPSQSLTVREILTRFVRSGIVDAQGHNVYFDGEDGQVDESCVDVTQNPDFDLADASAILTEIAQRKKTSAASKSVGKAKVEPKGGNEVDDAKAKTAAENSDSSNDVE